MCALSILFSSDYLSVEGMRLIHTSIQFKSWISLFSYISVIFTCSTKWLTSLICFIGYSKLRKTKKEYFDNIPMLYKIIFSILNMGLNEYNLRCYTSGEFVTMHEC